MTTAGSFSVSFMLATIVRSLVPGKRENLAIGQDMQAWCTFRPETVTFGHIEVGMLAVLITVTLGGIAWLLWMTGHLCLSRGGSTDQSVRAQADARFRRPAGSSVPGRLSVQR